eukprot:gb/GFBE01000800.1/.p3 GENE.gb/GFBE01000800.1/~~gb/GFBE01000800.1/.p3  ORF type:complete len:100 (-),score=36.31 gb/GFBE01000800.1/:57-356(-)
MARSSSVLLAIVPLALLAVAFCSAALEVFVPAPLAQEVVALRGAGPASAVATGALLAAIPQPAAAFSETELNQFGLVFAIFFLGFFIAGFFRMLTVGKL